MIKKSLILLLLAAAFVACSTANSIPIDDAYYSPAIESPTPTAATPVSQSDSMSAVPSTNIEYLNVQDTTVTIRIK